MNSQPTLLACTLAPLLALAACSSAGETSQADEEGKANATATATATARTSSAEGVAVKEETELFSYTFAYPAEVDAIPALASEIQRQEDVTKSQMLADAESDRKASRGGAFPYRQHSLSVDWKVVADLPGWLSLTREFATYTGGAHGIYGVTSLVWDKQEGRAMEGIDFFVSPGTLTSAVAQTYCPALDRQREAKNGAAPDRSDPFGQCPDVTELTIIPGSSNGSTFDRVGFYAGPYVAGSYAEGSYEVTLPVDARIMEAVKPEYRGTFSVKR